MGVTWTAPAFLRTRPRFPLPTRRDPTGRDPTGHTSRGPFAQLPGVALEVVVPRHDPLFEALEERDRACPAVGAFLRLLPRQHVAELQALEAEVEVGDLGPDLRGGEALLDLLAGGPVQRERGVRDRAIEGLALPVAERAVLAPDAAHVLQANDALVLAETLEETLARERDDVRATSRFAQDRVDRVVVDLEAEGRQRFAHEGASGGPIERPQTPASTKYAVPSSARARSAQESRPRFGGASARSATANRSASSMSQTRGRPRRPRTIAWKASTVSGRGAPRTLASSPIRSSLARTREWAS